MYISACVRVAVVRGVGGHWSGGPHTLIPFIAKCISQGRGGGAGSPALIVTSISVAGLSPSAFTVPSVVQKTFRGCECFWVDCFVFFFFFQ